MKYILCFARQDTCTAVLSHQLIRESLFLQLDQQDQLDRGYPELQGGLSDLLHQFVQFVPTYIALHMVCVYIP